MKSRTWRWLAALALCLGPLALLRQTPAVAQGGDRWTLLSLEGQEIRIFRDAYGVPHVFAPTNRALFYGYGYAIAQDRLWQLDLYRRTARGSLAEIFGPAALASDLHERLHGYTEAEYQDAFARLAAETQEILTSYRDGVNAYLSLALADPAHKLPWEFHRLSYQPAPWQVPDTLAIGRFMANRFGESGGQELQNQALLQSLISAHGTVTGTAMFNDLRWRNDPDAPVSVPTGSSTARAYDSPMLILPDIERIAAEVAALREGAARVWARYGIPTKLGSYAWAVSPSRSANGHALLSGGPQMGFDTPDLIHEIQLSGGQEFDVIGMSIAGIPLVLIGHNRSVAWSMTSGFGDNADIYVERLNPLNADQYWHLGAWRDMLIRTEMINVRGQPARTVTFRRTVHGPVMATDPANNLAYSLRRAHWMQETRMFGAALGMVRARNLADFQQGVNQYQVSNNFIYADTAGNIAYWQAGAIPIRPDGGHAGRLPWLGDGSQEWSDQLRAIPQVVNPAQGHLANWNNKPSADFDNGDAVLWGKQDRVSDIQEVLASQASVSQADMAAIPMQIAGLKWFGNETRFLRAYLLRAIAAEAPHDERLQEVASRLVAWDGRFVSDVVAGTRLQPEEEIWNAWLSSALLNTFGDELGSAWSEANLNTLLHALDGAASGVPPSRDYFDRVGSGDVETADQVLVQSLREALDILTARFGTPDIDSWITPRPIVSFVYPLGLVLGQIPISNRATYAQIVELSRPIVAVNIIPLGQSGFISPAGGLDHHFGDQLNLFRQFQYKPMQLLALCTVNLPAILRSGY